MSVKVEHWMCDCPQWFAIPTTYSQCAWCKAKQKYYSGKEKQVRFHKIFRPNYVPYQPKHREPKVKPYILRGRPRNNGVSKDWAQRNAKEKPQICTVCYGNLEKHRVRATRDWVCLKCQHLLSKQRDNEYQRNRRRLSKLRRGLRVTS